MSFLFLWTCLFWTLRVESGNTLLLYAWFLLFCTFPKLIHVLASINMPFHSLATQHSVAWICYSLLSIHQLIGNWIISNRKRESANFLLLFQDGFGSSVSHICILILGSTCQFLQKNTWNFDRNHTEYVDQSGRDCPLNGIKSSNP